MTLVVLGLAVTWCVICICLWARICNELVYRERMQLLDEVIRPQARRAIESGDAFMVYYAMYKTVSYDACLWQKMLLCNSIELYPMELQAAWYARWSERV